jgi:hypothetical protein
MKRRYSSALAGITGMVAAVSSSAAPVTIDTQQKAAAAAFTAHELFLGDNVSLTLPVKLLGVTDTPRDLADRTLQLLAAVTTPDALTAYKGAMTVPCPLGGSVKARLPRDGSLTLHLEWAACTMLQYPSDPQSATTFTGPGTVQLPESSFAPVTISLLRMGSITADLVATSTYAEEFSVTTSTRTMNVRMAGLIPMTRLSPTGPFIGDFDYRVTGFSRSHDDSTLTLPQQPPDHSTFDGSITIEQAAVSGSRTGIGGVEDGDLFVARGKFTTESSSSYAPEPRSFSVVAHDLHWYSV